MKPKALPQYCSKKRIATAGIRCEQNYICVFHYISCSWPNSYSYDRTVRTCFDKRTWDFSPNLLMKCRLYNLLVTFKAIHFSTNSIRTALAAVYLRRNCIGRKKAATCHRTPCHRPATVMPSTKIDPHCFEPCTSTSLPTATMLRNISFRLPAIVISCTGYWISPCSTQNPAAPRE